MDFISDAEKIGSCGGDCKSKKGREEDHGLWLTWITKSNSFLAFRFFRFGIQRTWVGANALLA